MIHDIVVEELERHLSGGGMYKNASQAFYSHLDLCEDCRTEVAEMDDLSAVLREFKTDTGQMDVPEPSLGFYARVRNDIFEKEKKQTWSLFSPGANFFRRVAFASLLLLAGLGSLLVTRESSFGGTDAASIMAQHDPVADHAESADRDRMLVTLATYQP